MGGARDQAALNTASGGSHPPTPPGEGATCPLRAALHLGVFFDGTGNNMYRDEPNGEHTNVARLHNVYKEYSRTAVIQSKQYIVGIGAGDAEDPGEGDWNNYFSQAFGNGGKQRLNIAYNWLKSQLANVGSEDEKVVDLFGFSRGAALARTFANLVVQGLVMGRGGETIVPRLRVRFIGIFDTVGSFGQGGDNYNIHQSMDIDNLGIPGKAHYTARHEQRHNFPLTMSGTDTEYPGVHSDVGGGYASEDDGSKVNHIAFIPFRDMWRFAKERNGLDMEDWLGQITISAGEVDEIERKANLYAGRGSTPAVPARGDGMIEETYVDEFGARTYTRERTINDAVDEDLYDVSRPERQNGFFGQLFGGDEFESDEHRNRYEFFEKYIHDSVSSWTPGMGRDSSGHRRKFRPKTRELTAKPPDFEWSGER